MSQKFKELLDQQHQWPDEYVFKFIVPVAQVSAVSTLLVRLANERPILQMRLKDPANWLTHKTSKKGTYCSLTARMMMPSSEAVLSIYAELSQITGLISL